MHTGFWWGNLRERDHLEDLGVDGRIILKWIVRTWDGGAWTALIWPRTGQVADAFKQSNGQLNNLLSNKSTNI